MDSDSRPPSRLRIELTDIAIWLGVGFLLSLALTLGYTHRMSIDDFVPTLLCGSVGFGMLAWIMSRPVAMFIRIRRRQRTLDRMERFECLKCGYPLKDLARGGTCPECGSPFGWMR